MYRQHTNCVISGTLRRCQFIVIDFPRCSAVPKVLSSPPCLSSSFLNSFDFSPLCFFFTIWRNRVSEREEGNFPTRSINNINSVHLITELWRRCSVCASKTIRESIRPKKNGDDMLSTRDDSRRWLIDEERRVMSSSRRERERRKFRWGSPLAR